jgi:hydrogenase/urease accessory protein HupE
MGHPEGGAPAAQRSATWAWLSRLAGAAVAMIGVALVWAAIRALGGD